MNKGTLRFNERQHDDDDHISVDAHYKTVAYLHFQQTRNICQTILRVCENLINISPAFALFASFYLLPNFLFFYFFKQVEYKTFL